MEHFIEDEDDQPYDRCPLCGPTIAAVATLAIAAALYAVPWLTLAFSAGVVTALVWP